MGSYTGVETEKKVVFTVLGIFLLCVLAFGIYVVYWAFYDLNRLPEGEFLTEESSPDGKYTLRAYVTNGGATTSYAVRGELVYNEKEYETKNIYWNYREETAEISWTDKDTVVINGVSLEVPGESFDFRHQ
ncbi:DUF5412 domain-containing protein [Rossellomorea sp. YZS02]|uniref:DUF5412 domain-containing protein n=1 Tax=Rossellomorea sp. YZS02 TaxID=3097358 RepID=UPI002A10445F|nr:DUF5412 domain-containing protein [Rossellomorea sp. YZS02]MDX8344585.1 DUF5412 domain-containing protein [Rossellomorea sp. YZS02]